jgi:hypothetical protein
MTKDKKSTTFGLSPDRIAELLSMGSDAAAPTGKPDSDEARAELLLDRLAGALAPDTSFSRFVPDIPEGLLDALPFCAGANVGDLLLNQDVSVALLRRVKDDNGQWSQRADTKVQKDVAVAIYYAAIAAALIFHRHKISGFSFAELGKAFGMLRQKSWIPRDMRDMYDKAIAVCRDPSGIEEDTAGR